MKTGICIRIVGLATGVPSECDGQYVKSYNAFAFGGQGDLLTTDDPTKAKLYPTLHAAFADYMTTTGTRPDGEPNRPMRAFTVEFLELQIGLIV